MSTPSDDEFEMDSWKVELEIALLEDADFFQIRKICGNRPLPSNSRADVWRMCLRPDVCHPQSMACFAEVFDLENQKQLHSDCENIAHEVLIQIGITKSASPTQPSADDHYAEDTDEFEDAVELNFKEDHVNSDQQPTVAQLTSDFESVLTHFCQLYKLKYKSELGWLAILKTLYLVMKPVDRQDLYGCFSSFYHHFLPVADSEVFQQVSAIFRLLLQYHEPKLCSFLDSLNLPPETYASPWCVTLFSQTVPYDVLISLWDIYFLIGDPMLVFFMVLVLLKNVKSELLGESEGTESESTKSGEGSDNVKRADSSRDQIFERIRNMATPMQVDDLTALFDLSQRFVATTPVSFRTLCTGILFTNNGDYLDSTQNDVDSSKVTSTGSTDIHLSLGSALCLKISVQELLDAQEAALSVSTTANKSLTLEPCAPKDSPSIRYLIVDCRPAEQYNAGHLSTAFFLDTSLILAEPPQFLSTVQTLLQSQQRALASGSPAAGEHIAILGNGFPEETATTNMVVAAFLRLNIPFVSVVHGGYTNLHGALDGNIVTLNKWLVHHNPIECLSCPRPDDSTLSQSVASGQAKDQSMVGDTKVAGHQNSASNPFKFYGESKPGDGFFSRVSGVLFNRTTVPASNTEDTRKPGTGKPTSQLHRVINKSVGMDKPKASPVAVEQSTAPQSENKKKATYRNTAQVFTIDGDEADDDEISEDITTTTATHSEASQGNDRKTSYPSTMKSDIPWFKRLTTSGSVTLSSPDAPSGDVPVRTEGLDSCQPGDLIDTTRWSSRPEVRGVFTCRFVENSGCLGESGFLVLVERHLLVMRVYRPTASNKIISSLGSMLSSAFHREQQRQSVSATKEIRDLKTTYHAEVLRSVPLTLINRITANRRLPECITFHYNHRGRDAADRLLMTANHSAGMVDLLKDRLYLPDAGEAFRIIKMAIYSAVTASKESAEA